MNTDLDLNSMMDRKSFQQKDVVASLDVLHLWLYENSHNGALCVWNRKTESDLSQE